MKKLLLSLLLLFTLTSFSQNKTFTLEYNKAERYIDNKLVDSVRSNNTFLFNISGGTDMAILYSDGYYERFQIVGTSTRVEGKKSYQKIEYKSYLNESTIEIRIYDKSENGLSLVIPAEKNEFKFFKI